MLSLYRSPGWDQLLEGLLLADMGTTASLHQAKCFPARVNMDVVSGVLAVFYVSIALQAVSKLGYWTEVILLNVVKLTRYICSGTIIIVS